MVSYREKTKRVLTPYLRPSNRLNIVPFNGKPVNGLKNINGSDYKIYFENPIKNALKLGEDVEIDILVKWVNGLPDTIITRYRINGGDWFVREFENIK